MKTQEQQLEHTLVAGKRQQLELPIGVTYLIPEDDAVRLLWEVLEGMDFTARESKNTTWSAQELFVIWALGTMTGGFSTRRVEEGCCDDIRYMWLLGGKRAPDHSTLSMFRQQVLPELLDRLFPEQMAYLSRIGETDYETVYIDGTKLKANANRYSFVWRKSVEKHLAKLKEKAASFCDGNVSLEQLEEQAGELCKEITQQGIKVVSGKVRH